MDGFIPDTHCAPESSTLGKKNRRLNNF